MLAYYRPAPQTPPIVPSTIGPVVYLLHFRQPLGNPTNPRAQAQHYIGWAQDLNLRLAAHLAGRGAAITRCAVERGIAWDVFVLGAGDRAFERRVKNLKNSVRLCPICGQRHPAGRLHIPGPAVDQLSLDIDGDPFDVPAPATRFDWWERRIRRSWSQAIVDVSSLDRDTSDCLIPL